VFCLVGADPADYGLSRVLVGPKSDGLVRIELAYVRGAHRPYLYKSLWGTYDPCKLTVLLHRPRHLAKERTMSAIQDFVNLAVNACTKWNLGYDQSNRLDFRDGGETDCSALVIICAEKTGLLPGNDIKAGKGATFTGNMAAAFAARGWQVHRPALPASQLRPGDVLLNDADHTAIYIGNGQLAQASIDEHGNAAGGASGNQSGRETNVMAYYNFPWTATLRHPAPAPVNPAPATPGSDRLITGQSLHMGESIKSRDGNHTLILQLDGNLVLYTAPGKPIWNTATVGTGDHFVLQGDSNLVLYDNAGKPLHAWGGQGTGANHLVVQNDGNLVLYKDDPLQAIWATNTQGR